MKSDAEIEAVVRQALDGLGMAYEVLACDPQYADTAQFCEQYGYAPDECGNTILVGSRREPKEYSACVVKASDRLDVNKTVRKLMGVRRLSFASTEETIEVTGMMIGGVTTFALPKEIPLYVDAKVMDLDTVILGSGSRSSKIRVAPAVFELISAQVIEVLSL